MLNRSATNLCENQTPIMTNRISKMLIVIADITCYKLENELEF